MDRKKMKGNVSNIIFMYQLIDCLLFLEYLIINWDK